MTRNDQTEFTCDNCGDKSLVESFVTEDKNRVVPLPDGWVTMRLRRHPHRASGEFCSFACARTFLFDFMKEEGESA